MTRAYVTKSDIKPDVVSFTQAMNPIRQPNLHAYSVWIISLIFVQFQFLIQLSSGQIIDGLMRSFSLSALGGGFLASAYYYIYVTLQTPGGVMIDYFGPRKVLSIGGVVLTVGCFWFATAHMLWLAFVGRLLMGGGAAFAFVGALTLLTRWFPKNRFGIMTGITETIGMLSTLVGGFALAYFVEKSGWRDCMLGGGVIAGIITVLVFTVVRNDPPYRQRLKKRPKRRVMPSLRVLLRMRVAWFNGIYSGLMFSVVTVFSALWAIPFMQKAHHLDLVHATLLCNITLVGIAIGCPFLSWADNYIPHRRYLTVGFAIFGCLVVSMLIFYVNSPIWFLYVLFLFLGVAASIYVLTFAIANEIAATRIKSASIGLVNTLSVGAAPILQTLVGLILTLLSAHTFSKGVHHYALSDYKIALSIIPALLIVAAVIGWFLPNRRIR
ncbi:MAG: MFS transporter [Gammaproteobacteria bacterium]|nr:MFS transporter [Gammaproteobacteria bacterium]MCH9744220.1 MFS transporter [Gammaproteobacteria bacterium]